MLSLNDPVWYELTSAYGGDCEDLLEWLRTAASGGFSRKLLDDIVNDANHQGDTSTSMYAVAIVLIDLAARQSEVMRSACLIAAGMLYADSGKPGAVPCPQSLLDKFEASSAAGRRLLLDTGNDRGGFIPHLYFLAALSGFSGYKKFGRLLEGFDESNGEYCHTWIDGVLPDPDDGG